MSTLIGLAIFQLVAMWYACFRWQKAEDRAKLLESRLERELHRQMVEPLREMSDRIVRNRFL